MRKTIYRKFKGCIKEMNKSVFNYRFPVSKVSSELSEHFTFIKWVMKRIFLPLATFYVLSGFLLGLWVVDSLFLGLIIFLYSNFLPDVDSIFKVNPVKYEMREKYSVLFFAPIYVLYLLSENAARPQSAKPKPFHNVKSMAAYGIFLLLIGFIFYRNWLEIIFVPVFGIIGYFTHLSVDRSVRL